jgi:phospholipase C
LFGTVFRLALDALVPKVELGGSTVRLSLGDELLAMAGKSGVHETFHVPVSVSQSKLQSIKIDALAGRDLLAAADKLHRKSQFTQVKPDDIALRIQAAFDKPIDITFDAVITELDVAHLNGEIGEVWLAFNAQLTQLTPLSHIAIDFSTLSGVALSVASVFTDINHHVVDDKIEGLLRGTDASQLIRTYLREVLSRALGPTSVVIDVHGTAEGWVLEYYDNPFPDEHYRPRPDAGETAPHGPLGGGALPTVDTSTLSPPTESAPPPPPGGGPPPPSSDPLGVWPTEFLVAGGPALTRLDRVKTLIFVMMENRSFDHMLGDLQRVRPRPNDRYDCSNSLDYAATNPTTGGLEGPIRLRTAASIGLGTAIPVSPHHHIDRVLFQIGGGDSSTLATGAMQGFTRDLTDRTDSSQIAMTYYQEAQVPTYYRLADEFKVCDRWFAALPGATWPNRWATLMGTIPEIDNIPSDDPRIGFLKGPTIFDTLSAYNIDWRVYEASLSIIRMFDKYRLDDRHVLPLFDETDGLAALLKSNQALPRVLFVEPRFVDIPPLSLATDDHPPADVAHGQQFIADLCNLLWSTNRWEDVSLFITYDEHGGFYDHVPPPGSPKGPPELVGTIAKLHPDAPAMLGVRVPSFVVSPYVNTASVSHETYDHTSILKTILVHNRAKLPQHVFTSFGPRVNAATHLGTALDRDTPRPAPAAFKRGRPGTTVTPPHGPLTPPITPTVVTAHPPISHPPIITHPPVVTTQPPLPHAPPGHGPLPPTTPPGTLAPPAGGSPAAPPPLAAIGNSAAPETKEPNDFHLALRQALKPKRRT